MPYVIDDSTSTDVTHTMARGAVPRDYAKYPQGYLDVAPPVNIPLIPRSEWSARIKERKQRKTRLVDLRRGGAYGFKIPCLNQNDKYGRRVDGEPAWGYCWAHSVTMCHMMLRAAMGQPYKKLSAFMVAATIKNHHNQGGWGALALEFIEKNGQCEDEFWPESEVGQKWMTQAMRDNAAKYKITGGWGDLATPVYSRSLTEDQMATLLLSGVPVVGDYNWWGHSVCLLDWDEPEPGSFGPLGINSWGDGWGDEGEFTLQGSRRLIDGGVAPTVVMAA